MFKTRYKQRVNQKTYIPICNKFFIKYIVDVMQNQLAIKPQLGTHNEKPVIGCLFDFNTTVFHAFKNQFPSAKWSPSQKW